MNQIKIELRLNKIQNAHNNTSRKPKTCVQTIQDKIEDLNQLKSP